MYGTYSSGDPGCTLRALPAGTGAVPSPAAAPRASPAPTLRCTEQRTNISFRMATPSPAAPLADPEISTPPGSVPQFTQP